MGNYAEAALVHSMGYLADAQAAVANNLANVNTEGYKRRVSVAQRSQAAFEDMLGAKLPQPSYSEATDWTAGSLRPTGNRLHVSVEGEGMFVVQGAAGQKLYTRQGQLHINDQGMLTTAHGEAFLGEGGEPIQMGDAANPVRDFSIGTDGTISENGGDFRAFGRIQIVRFDNRSALQPIGHGLFHDRAGQQPSAEFPGLIRQGTLEGSNVQTVDELVQMLQVQRTFQATQRALSSVGRLQASYINTMNR